MSKSKKLLPLGSVVYLEEGTQKLIVVGRGAIFDDPDTDSQVFADYMGVLYPQGLQTNSTFFFQHENIDKVIFEGYRDEEESRFLEIYHEWESKSAIPRKKID